MLQNNHIEKLLNDFPIGDLVKFQHNIEQWKKLKVPNESKTHEQEKCTIKGTQISVMEILENTYNGKEILDFYRKNDTLYEEQRNLLINTIGKYIEAKGVEFSLSACSVMEKEICSIFPSEQLV